MTTTSNDYSSPHWIEVKLTLCSIYANQKIECLYMVTISIFVMKFKKIYDLNRKLIEITHVKKMHQIWTLKWIIKKCIILCHKSFAYFFILWIQRHYFYWIYFLFFFCYVFKLKLFRRIVLFSMILCSKLLCRKHNAVIALGKKK